MVEAVRVVGVDAIPENAICRLASGRRGFVPTTPAAQFDEAWSGHPAGQRLPLH